MVVTSPINISNHQPTGVLKTAQFRGWTSITIMNLGYGLVWQVRCPSFRKEWSYWSIAANLGWYASCSYIPRYDIVDNISHHIRLCLHWSPLNHHEHPILSVRVYPYSFPIYRGPLGQTHGTSGDFPGEAWSTVGHSSSCAAWLRNRSSWSRLKNNHKQKTKWW